MVETATLLTTLLLLHVVYRHYGLILVVLVDGRLLLLLLPLLAPISTVATIALAVAAVSTATLTIALAIVAAISSTFATPVPLALPLRALVLVVRPPAGEAPLRWPFPLSSLVPFPFGPVSLLPATV